MADFFRANENSVGVASTPYNVFDLHIYVFLSRLLLTNPLYMKYSAQFSFLGDSGDISGVTEYIFLKKEKIVLSSGVLKILYHSG